MSAHPTESDRAIPYVARNLTEPSDLLEAIRKRRGGDLLNLDRMLLHSPPFARGWNAFLGAVRTELALEPKLMELAICVVAVLNRADYEFNQHAPLFQSAGGNKEQVQALRDPDIAATSVIFLPVERAAISLTIAMTFEIEVPVETLQTLKGFLPGNRELVELIGTIAAYNMVSRFLVATGVTPE
ncbi:MAG: carboxymuconolactone decarboxylase family protein [Gammaproteobacteria bacterium]|nr:carboxymuconolactone decarboxylase family protein [Gammaproteobacteria bacterium]